ncbi:MAG: class I SAM-dependent methyltransferase [Alphaproteobacteria bacterium]|nr:class I SAM-dependent methyltransferase [Alphaproteobacteria bacterium]
MDEREFDKFAEEYTRMHQENVRLSGEDIDFFAAYKINDMREVWSAAGEIEPKSILDFGGGIGVSAPHLRRVFPQTTVTIADVSRRSLEVAERRGVERVTTQHFDGVTLPFEDGHFDIALAACVFHHIDAAQHVSLLAEIRRVLRHGGRLMVFEHNPWNPLTRHAVNTCPFDENAVLISGYDMQQRMRDAGFSDVSLTWRLFVPGALRGLRPLEAWLGWFPLGAQYRAVGTH